jgi:hypothetical protein
MILIKILHKTVCQERKQHLCAVFHVLSKFYCFFFQTVSHLPKTDFFLIFLRHIFPEKSVKSNNK